MLDLLPGDARRTALTSFNPTPSRLIKFELPAAQDGVRLWTDHPHGLTVNGETYLSDNPLTGTTLPDVNSEIGRSLYTLQLADPTGEWRDRIGESYSGIKVTASVVFLLGDGSLTEPLLIYKGRSVSLRSSNGGSGHITSINFSGPLAKQDGEASVSTSVNNQSGRDPTDTCFDYAHVSKDLDWGR